MMQANIMSEVSGGPKEIIFDRMSSYQKLRCKFDFEMVKATFEEVQNGTS
jgi:alpha-glucosidase